MELTPYTASGRPGTFNDKSIPATAAFGPADGWQRAAAGGPGAADETGARLDGRRPPPPPPVAEPRTQNVTAQLFALPLPGPSRRLWRRPHSPAPLSPLEQYFLRDPRRIRKLARFPAIGNRADMQRAAEDLLSRAVASSRPGVPTVLSIGTAHDSTGCLALQKDVLNILKDNPELKRWLGLRTLYVELPQGDQGVQYRHLLGMLREMERTPGGAAGYLAGLHLEPPEKRQIAQFAELQRAAAAIGMRTKYIDRLGDDRLARAVERQFAAWSRNGVTPNEAEIDEACRTVERSVWMSTDISQDVGDGHGGIVVTGNRHMPSLMACLGQFGINAPGIDLFDKRASANHIAYQLRDYERNGIKPGTGRLQIFNLLNAADRY